MKIAIVNGPNLNLVGKRETNVYGVVSLDEYLSELSSQSPHEIIVYQSNVEGELIDFLQQTRVDGILYRSPKG